MLCASAILIAQHGERATRDQEYMRRARDSFNLL